MRYSDETIKRIIKKMNEIETSYNDVIVDNIKSCISTGNRKIGRVMNVSLPPIKTCANCKECKYLCYDIKACLQYASCLDARIRNLVILKKDRNEYFNRIDKKISRRKKNKFFRWHVAGDIVDIDYFDRMVQIARNHSDFVFWTYTKNYDVVNEYVRTHGNDRNIAIPSNLTIMYSEWRGMTMNNPYNFPIFTVRFMNEEETDFRIMHNVTFKCPGNCDICKSSNHGCIVGENTYCDEH